MSEPLVWQDCWLRLNEAFVVTAGELMRCNSQIWVQTGRRSAELRSFEAWAEFKRLEDPARVEDVVVFCAIRLDGDVYVATIDISTGEGMILVDGPTLTVAADPLGAWRDTVIAYVTNVERFLCENSSFLRDALC